MQPREKILAGVLAGAVVIWFALPAFNSWFVEPLELLESQELGLQEDVQQKQKDRLNLAKADRDLREWKSQSLPPDTLDAQRLYQEWLTHLAELSGFRDIKVTPVSTSAEGRNLFHKLQLRIVGTATFEQLQQFRVRFQEVRLLQRIVSSNTSSKDSQGNPLLHVDLMVEGISLPDAEARKRLFPETTLTNPAAATLTKINVSENSSFPKAAPFQVRIGRELLNVTSLNGQEWTVERGILGTYPADHDAEDVVELHPVRADNVPGTSLKVTSLFAKPSPPVVYNPKIAVSVTPVIRGVPWTWKPVVTGWNPAEPDPVFKLQDAPEGMTIDPSTGQITWNPDDTVETGQYSATLIALSAGQERVTANIPLRLRLPNNPPDIEPIQKLTFYFGRESTARVNCTDPDVPQQFLTYSLEGAPEGMVIDPRTGLIRWTPNEALEAQSLAVTVNVTDSDEMPLMASIRIPISIEEDAAKYTRLWGVTRFGRWKASLLNIATNEDTEVYVGDQVKVADIEFKVLDIQRKKIIVDRDGKPFRLELGEFVVSLTPASPDEVPAVETSTTESPGETAESSATTAPAAPPQGDSPAESTGEPAAGETSPQ